ncbi:hypothetical protein YC2023_112387 [Brassica napus]
MSFGVTKWLGIYSNTQFESVSSKVITLSSSIVTILMLFFGGQDKINIEGERELYVKLAGYLGMIYVTAALFDAKARPRLAGFRIISILCSYLSVWFLIYAIFERHSIPFVVISIGITLGGYIASVQMRSHKGHTQMQTRSQTRSRIKSLESPGNPTGMKLKPDMSETSHRSSKVLTPSLEVIPGGKGKATMSGGGSTGRGKSQPKTDPKIGKSRCAEEEAKPRKKKKNDELKTAVKARGEAISTKR